MFPLNRVYKKEYVKNKHGMLKDGVNLTKPTYPVIVLIWYTTYLCFQKVKLFSTRVEHGVKILKVCKLATENLTNVSLKSIKNIKYIVCMHVITS